MFLKPSPNAPPMPSKGQSSRHTSAQLPVAGLEGVRAARPGAARRGGERARADPPVGAAPAHRLAVADTGTDRATLVAHGQLTQHAHHRVAPSVRAALYPA